jgi:hypothetical protein
VGGVLLSCDSAEPTPRFTLEVAVEPDDGGSATPSSGEFEEGQTVDITADPADGFRFQRWEGTGKTGREITITIEENTELTAVFTRIQEELETTVDGEGSIEERVAEPPKQSDFDQGALVELTARPDEGWIFSEWQGDLTGSQNPDSLRMDEDKSVTAVFERRDFDVSVDTEGEGSVSQTKVGQKKDAFAFGSRVELEASPSEGWRFDRWEGDLTGPANPDTITVDTTKSITAVFEKRTSPTETYPVETSADGNGTVETTLLSGEESGGEFTEGSKIELSARPAGGWRFQEWQGDLMGSVNPDTVIVDGPTSITAAFEEERSAVTATLTGTTAQEGRSLPGASVTFANADADTTVGTTTSGSNGNYSFSTSYPEGQAYQLDITANTGDHEAKTKTVNLGTSSGTYTKNFDLERLAYEVTINAEDASTGSPADVDGAVLENGSPLTGFTTGSDGQATVEINTPAGQVTSEAGASGYDSTSTTVSLGGQSAVSATNSLPPIQYTYSGTVRDGGGSAVPGAEITADDRDGNQVTTTTASDGGYSLSVTVNDGVMENETIDLTASKPGFERDTKTTSADPADRTKTKDFTIAEQAGQIVATFSGTVDQEGTALPDADMTVRNADADTTVTTTTTGGSGFYETSTSYPEDQAYTAHVIANTPEHRADTTTVGLGTSGDTYSNDFNLERLVYEITAVTEDSVTGAAISASGDIRAGGTTLTSFTTGSDGQTTLTINTAAGQVTSEAGAPGYDPASRAVALGGDRAARSALALSPITYAFEGTVTDGSGNALSGATVQLEDTDGNALSASTDAGGGYRLEGTINDGLEEGESLTLTASKSGFDAQSKGTSADPDSRSKTLGFTLSKQANAVTATLDGTTRQEGQPLPGADVTFVNADADTTVGATTSGSNGNYSFSTSYPEGQAYTLSIQANTDDHEAATKTVTLGTTDQTYTRDFDLERLVYEVTINTGDANTGDPVNASGTVVNNGTSLASYTTGSNGQTTVTINTAAGQVTSEADTTGYDPSNETVSLGADKQVSSTLNLPPITYTFDGTVTDDNGTALSGADITLDDNDGNQLSTTTASGGGYALTGTINDGLEEDETLDITADKDGYNPSTKQSTADPGDRDKTTSFALTAETVSYTVEGDVTSSDGDTVTDNTIHIVSPSDDTVATTTPDTNGFYSTSTTQDELGGDQADIESDPAGYDPYTTTKTLSEGTNTQNITLQEILRGYQFNAEDGNGNPLGNVSLDIDETTTGDRDVTTLTTDSNGDASTTLSVDEQIIGGDQLTITASKDGYNNAETTDVVDNESETITLSLQEQTTTYDITGTVTDEDGDQLSGKDVLIQTPSDNAVASTTTASDGSYSVSVTQEELGGDTGEVESNPTGYNKVETTKTFSEGTNTVDLSLPLTEYTRTFDVNDADGNALANASIDGDETTSGDRDVFTATTNSSGEHTETMTIDDMIADGDQLEYEFNKDGYNAATKTETLTDTTKTISASLSEQSTTDRITITFTPKTVGNSLYSGGYSGELDYTVSTGDTTFTTSGSTTADVPITDGDQLEISQSDSEYISTFMVNNTDTEPPPMQVTPFPAEPDYQSTSTVTIDKSNLVNEYQVAGIPNTSPEGYNTIDDWKPHLNKNQVRRWTDLGGYSSLETYIQEGHGQDFEDRADTVVPEVQGFMPIPTDGPTYVTDSELQDIFDERDERNITRVDGGGNSFGVFTEGNYLKNTSAKFSGANNYATVRSEVYGAFTGMDEDLSGPEDHFVTVKILDDSGEFIPNESKFPIRIIYSTESPTNIY